MIFLFLECCQALGCPFIVETLSLLVVGICPLPQGPVVHIATTPKGTGKYALLLLGGVAPVLVGAFLLHLLHDSIQVVRYQRSTNLPPNKGRASYPIPMFENRGFT